MPINKENVLIFTDLDGTLLDHNDYNYAAVVPVLDKLESLGIPVIFNTSKTRAEIISLRKEIGNKHPFIVENGSGVFIPKNYFSKNKNDNASTSFDTLCFGAERTELISWLKTEASEFNQAYTNFYDLTTEGIVKLTGLPYESAKLAGTRDFSEPLHWTGSKEELKKFTRLAEKSGFSILIGGRFVHLLGKTDKGIATKMLAKEYQKQAVDQQGQHVNKPFSIIACGDGKNDIAMLEAADVAVIVKSPANPPPSINNSDQHLTEEYGPEGWAKSMTKILNL